MGMRYWTGNGNGIGMGMTAWECEGIGTNYSHSRTPLLNTPRAASDLHNFTTQPSKQWAHTDDVDCKVSLLSDRVHFKRRLRVLDATLKAFARRRRQEIVLNLLTYRAA